jgi:hypothetical protein
VVMARWRQALLTLASTARYCFVRCGHLVREDPGCSGAQGQRQGQVRTTERARMAASRRNRGGGTRKTYQPYAGRPGWVSIPLSFGHGRLTSRLLRWSGPNRRTWQVSISRVHTQNLPQHHSLRRSVVTAAAQCHGRAARPAGLRARSTSPTDHLPPPFPICYPGGPASRASLLETYRSELEPFAGNVWFVPHSQP